jgi:hypothetical protein
MFFIAFPLLLIPFALYNMIAFLLNMQFTDELFGIGMLSGARMSVTIGDFLIAISLFLLYVEILKATRMGVRAIMDHVLSMVLFIVMLIEFIMVQKAATSTFFLLLVLSLIDVMGGFTITIRGATRDMQVERVASTEA